MDILIVEDSPNIRSNLKKLLIEMRGVNISGEAENFEYAIELINKIRPDLIILDIELKSSSGFDVLKYVKRNENPHKPIVIMFSNYSTVYKEKALNEKADYFFDKTTELDKLLSTIKSLI